MIKIVIAAVLFLTQTSIYSYKVNGITGTEIDFDSFRGKKILVVNIATGSPRVSQLAGLQELQEQYSDSLVIVAFPSGSFGNEGRSNTAIKEFCQSQYGVSFLLAAKGSVTGDNIQPFYYWLTHREENGQFGNEIKGDFQKYLFDKDGTPLGIFSGLVSPLDQQFINVITGNQN